MDTDYCKILHEKPHWLYFNRSLKIFENEVEYLFKPMQMAQWSLTKALCDADDVIGDSIARGV